MNYKKTGKIIGIIAVCIIAVIFLYSRMHVSYNQYGTEDEQKKEQGEQQTEQGDNQEKIAEFPETYQKKVDDKLEFDVEVICREGIAAEGVSMATASIMSLDQQKIYQYFMGESDNVKKEVIDNYKGIDGQISVLTSYTDDNGCELWTADKEGAYTKPLFDYIQNCFFIDKYSDNYNEELYSRTSDLSFMSREEAWENLKNNMKEMNLDVSGIREKAVYSLDVDTLQKEETCIDLDGNVVEKEMNPNWTKEDEGYYYFLTQEFEGLPVYEEYGVGMGEGQIDISPLVVYQTKDGICYYNISGCYTFQKQEGVYQLASFNTIMDTLEEKYTGTVNTNPLKVEKAVLYEYPIHEEGNTYTLFPVWICTLAEQGINDDKESYISYFRIPINAVTGEEMPELEE